MVQIHYRPPPTPGLGARTGLANEGTKIERQSAGLKKMPSKANAPTDEELAAIVAGALGTDAGLTPLKGFNLDLSANPGFRRVFFSASCDCGTAGLLSVEVAGDKTLEEVREALPSLIEGIREKARSFYNMPCAAHQRMRLGAVAERT